MRTLCSLARFGSIVFSLIACEAPGFAFADSPAPYVIEGPAIVEDFCMNGNVWNGKYCYSVSYDNNSNIPKKRYVMAPRGNLLFRFLVHSKIPVPQPAGTGPAAAHVNVSFKATVTAVGMNPGEVAVTKPASVVLHGVASAWLQVPVNVDWTESVVRVQFDLQREVCQKGSVTQKLGLVQECSSGAASVSGPSLASISLGSSTSTAFPNDAFIVVVSPAAAFQLPLVPVAIIYGSLGNLGKSKYTVTETTGASQKFTDSNGTTYGFSTDDKVSYSDDLSVNAFESFEAGASFKGSWDHSTSSDTTVDVWDYRLRGANEPNAGRIRRPATKESTCSE